MKKPSLFGRALEVYEKALGPDHPDVKNPRHTLVDGEGRRREDERERKAGEVRLMMAIVSSLAEGEALLASVRNGTDFQGQDAGFVLPSDLDPRLADAVKDLEVGEVSNVVETEKGYFVLKRTE